jgi:YVTN family beta-propeller protein
VPTHSPRLSMALRLIAPALLLLALTVAAAAEPLVLPGPTGWQVWRADQAQAHGAWQAGVPDADGSRYLQPDESGDAWLDFSFATEEPLTLQVRPEWWRTGEQKLARRFPYPLARQFGPTALAAVGAEVFALAPAAGRVVVIDAATEKPVAAIDVGGYLTDLVADPDQGRIYLADAQGSRLVAIDCASRRLLGTLDVAGRPWALALLDGKLYVACRDGKRVVAFDTTSGDQTGEARLALSPVSLEVAGSPARVVVRFEDQVYDPLRLTALVPDQVQCPPPSTLPSKPQPPCGGPDCGCVWVEFPSPLTLDFVSRKGRTSVSLAAPIAKMFTTPPPGFTAADLQYASLYLGSDKKRHVFFTVPNAGEVWEVTDDGVMLDPIALGGTPTGLSIDTSAGKLYVADSANDHVSVVDVATRKVERTLRVTGHPTSLTAVKQLAWQREENRPPLQVNRLYVACTAPNSLAVLDLGSGKEVRRLPLSGEAAEVQLVPMPNTGWWPELADDRVPLALQPKLAVAARPALLDPETFQITAAPETAAPLAPARASLALAVGGQTKTFAAQDDLLVHVDGTRLIDVTAMADPQRLPEPPLTKADTPGTITLSLDGGPEYDWAKGVWVAPESKMLQVNGSDEFWRHNAAAFTVPAGEHVLRVRAHSPYARLQGVALRRAPESQLALSLLPEPRARHAQVPLPSYQGLFYDQEPVQFTLAISNAGPASVDLALSHELRNYLGAVVASAPPATVTVPAGATITQRLDFAPADMGRFTLTVTAVSPQGEERAEARFVRLPRLEHPRLFWRKDDEPAIRARIARYPNLFRRYADWLERNVTREGNFPERFLPPGLTAAACESAAPEGMEAGLKHDACAWRMYELGWRILATQFAGLYLKPSSHVLQQKLSWLQSQEKTDAYVQPHHHGPFFPGAAATVVDLAPDSARESMPLWKQFRGDQGQMNTPAWTLVTIEPPLDPMERAMLYEFATWISNAERYFDAHRGARGGLWWSDPYTSCHCPMQGYAILFMMARNVLGEPRLFDDPIFRGYFTFQRYADPLQDNRTIQPRRRNPNGEPWRWIVSALSHHPVEKSIYDWEGWIRAMEGPMNDEQAEVDRLMSLQGRPLTVPLLEGYKTDGATSFVSGVAVPIALALGWYEPEAEEVKLEDTPASAVFDGEGWAAMRSGWGKDATEVTLISGVRDHTTRHKPNHLTIAQDGEYLLGTPALWPDDGNNVAIWSNSVVVDDGWEDQWTMNLVPPRHGEHVIIDRFSPAAWTYLARDRTLTPYQPAENGWGAGLNLHGHTETLFMQEGDLLAYQSWPEVDYAAGDASNAWPVDKVSRIDRQVVFVKPDVVVVYDRVKLGPEGHGTRWLAATGPEVKLNGPTFRIRSGAASLQGRFVLPAVKLTVTAPKDENGWIWKGQRRLEARPVREESETEYLVLMRVGGADAPLPAPELRLSGGRTGLKYAAAGRTIEVQFYRTAAAGGEVAITDAAGARHYQLHQGVDSSYANWSDSPLYRRWSSEARFDFVIADGK